MNFPNTIDLSKAFDKLKAGLKECEAVIDDKEQFPDMMDRFAKAHGWLLAHVTHFIRTVEQTDPVLSFEDAPRSSHETITLP